MVDLGDIGDIGHDAVEMEHEVEDARRTGQHLRDGLREAARDGLKHEAEEIATRGGEGMWQKFRDSIRAKPHFSRIVWSRVLAEVGAIAAAGAVAGIVGNSLLNRPWDALKKRFSKAVVEPNLEKIDTVLGQAKSFDPPEDRAERHVKPEADQAKQITDFFADNYVLKAGGAIAGQYVAQAALTKAFRVRGVTPGVNAVSVFGDRAVGVGSVLFLNTMASEQSVNAQKNIESVLKKSGMSEKEAEGWASYAVNIQLPNLAGLLASVGILAAFARR